MEKLKKIIDSCKCGFYLSINQHRDYYETVEQHFSDFEELLENIDPIVYNKMKELNTIIDLHFYPNTPIGFYQVYHYDLDKAIDKACDIINELNENK